MNTSFYSFIGDAKNIRLNPVEKKAMKAVLGFTRPLVVRSSSSLPKTDKLFAYEKAMMWNMLADMTKQKPARTKATEEAPLTIAVWHGSVFRHLQPFVLTQQD